MTTWTLMLIVLKEACPIITQEHHNASQSDILSFVLILDRGKRVESHTQYSLPA
jgi:hypothetical protein